MAPAHRAKSRRRTIRKEALAPARQALAGAGDGCEIVCLTHGQFSLADALIALVEQVGPSKVTVATWTAAEVDVTAAHALVGSGAIRSIRWLVDRSFLTRQPEYCAVLRDKFGDEAIRTTRLHAKFATIRSDGVWLAVRTSMNLNSNPRLELIEVSGDPALADFLDGQVDEFFRAPAGEFNGGLPAVEKPDARARFAANRRRAAERGLLV